MRALIIDEEARQKVQAVLAYARANPYRLPSLLIPGHNPKFVARIGDFRCVFTFTHCANHIYRHLSISVPGSAYPNPYAVYMLATDLFEFTDWDGKSQVPPVSWTLDVGREERCITVMQELK